MGTRPNLTLNNVNINTTTGAALDMQNATVNLWLEGSNVLNASGATNSAGLQTNGGILTINGTGSLEAIGGASAAGIGGGFNINPFLNTSDGGNITINGGNVIATGSHGGAGIGGGAEGNAAIINIAGGNITANSGSGGGAGIGGGFGGGIDNVAPTLTISGGLVQIADGQWIGGAGLGYGTGTTNVVGGNLSINPDNINSSLIHLYNNQPAFRVQITLEGANGNTMSFGAHTAVTYNINGFYIDAITDSAGNLFMYLPADFAGNGVINFNGQTFRGELNMEGHHNNQLVLSISEEEDPIDPTDPIDPSPREGKSLHFQIGANTGNSLFLNIKAMDSQTLGLRDGNDILIDVLHESGINIAPLLNILDSALAHVTKERASLGATQNRLEFTIHNLDIASENLSATESRIRDADMAKEMKILTKANILQ